MVLCHSMNAGLVVGTLKDSRDSRILPAVDSNQIHLNFFALRYSGDTETSSLCSSRPHE